MASKTEICNLAISHIGIGKEISNLDTDSSEEAKACRRYYETAKKITLADVDWSFATKFATLNLIETTPTDEWDYSYRYPSDCLSLRRIKSGIRSDNQDSRIPFKIVSDATGLLIYSDQPEAAVEYTYNVTSAALFTEEFKLALSFRLAEFIAARLTGGDPFKIKQEMMQQYNMEIGKAIKKNNNEEVGDQMPESEFIRVRGTYAQYGVRSE